MTRAGHVFATYHHGDAPPHDAGRAAAGRLQFTANGYLDVTRKIEHDGRAIGTIYLHTSMQKLYDQIFWYVNIVAVVMIGSLARIHRIVVSLAARDLVADSAVGRGRRTDFNENNYDIRVSKIADDELGTLYDQFNAMLEQIQQRDAAIQWANDDLEMKVENRTLATLSSESKS